MRFEVNLYRTFSELLEEAVEKYSDDLFLEDYDGRHTYGDLYNAVLGAASCLKMIPDRYIILNIREQYAFAIVYFAAVLTGHVACLLPENHPIPKHVGSGYVIDDSEAKALLSLSPIKAEELPEIDPELPCTVAFSSGTSSKNKGCVLSQRNLLHDAQYSMMYFHYWRGERLVHMLPFWHLFGVVADLIGPIHYGCGLFVPKTSASFFNAMQYFRPHCINMPPALADTLCLMLEKNGDIGITGGCLKKILCAGAPMNIQTATKLMEFGILPCTAYGLTECSPCVAITPDNDLVLGTVGKVIPCTDVKIEDGEILVAGTTVMLGYFEDDELTRRKITDGYFHTGDIGYFDTKGYLVITGRKDNMLTFSNGMKCMPEAVESRVNAVAGVKESMLCVGFSGKQTFPRLIAVVERAADVKGEITLIMKQENLYPFILEITSKKLKRNDMGKVVRR